MRVRAEGVATRSDARRICTAKARGAPGSHLPRRARVRIEITWEIQGRYRGDTGEIEGAHRDHLEGAVPHGRAWV